jgi:hypothetical protein
MALHTRKRTHTDAALQSKQNESKLLYCTALSSSHPLRRQTYHVSEKAEKKKKKKKKKKKFVFRDEASKVLFDHVQEKVSSYIR